MKYENIYRAKSIVEQINAANGILEDLKRNTLLPRYCCSVYQIITRAL
jgi:hypothetical protein